MVRDRWSWVEESVWTERILEAQGTGLEARKCLRLVDKVMSERTLQRRQRRRGGITKGYFEKDC